MRQALIEGFLQDQAHTEGHVRPRILDELSATMEGLRREQNLLGYHLGSLQRPEGGTTRNSTIVRPNPPRRKSESRQGRRHL